ncbi:CopG family transcriptional regulator [Silvibacterium dinghuense]|uniref:CopG family transcriptional regulator n=1 Tax=Silvibacterium dinghuense TaxID=1560006 RepID=A0A4Q1SI22_9BACT|nr:CopG family transcriptional regulator [Silvibacterium dinghuense]RXS97045.1 CopG family transcriptional regulator [Silvibacterium dinghuense]GGG95720.1 CopG family transcriptional regulator [Silvibacterium dinghuense]
MRTLVDIPAEDLDLMHDIVGRLGISRAELVRRAITSYLAPYRGQMTHEAFGLWTSSHSGESEDGVAYQERMRSEW